MGSLGVHMKGVLPWLVRWARHAVTIDFCPEAVFLNFYGAQESIPPAYVAWRDGTTTLFLLSF
jgi:hypothetical protein